MTHQTISITEHFPRSLEQIFSYLSAHENLSTVFGIPVKRVVDAAGANPNGQGSVRRLGRAPIAIEETITAFEKDRLIEYRVTKGGMLKHHLGTMRFRREGEGSTLDYTIEIESKVPFLTAVIKSLLDSGIRKGLRKLARQPA